MVAGVVGAPVRQAVAVEHKPALAIILHLPMVAQPVQALILNPVIHRPALSMVAGVTGAHVPQAVAPHKPVAVQILHLPMVAHPVRAQARKAVIHKPALMVFVVIIHCNARLARLEPISTIGGTTVMAQMVALM
jgi:L-serine deaminase